MWVGLVNFWRLGRGWAGVSMDWRGSGGMWVGLVQAEEFKGLIVTFNGLKKIFFI